MKERQQACCTTVVQCVVLLILCSSVEFIDIYSIILYPPCLTSFHANHVNLDCSEIWF